jgi:hypothetical protein
VGRASAEAWNSWEILTSLASEDTTESVIVWIKQTNLLTSWDLQRMLVLSVYSVEIGCKLCREIVHAYILSTNPLAWWYVMKDRMENIKSVQQQLLYSILWTRSHRCRADDQQQQQLMVPWSYQEADLKEWVSGIANKLTRITQLSWNRFGWCTSGSWFTLAEKIPTKTLWS